MKTRLSSLVYLFQIVCCIFEKVLHFLSVGKEDNMATLAHSVFGHGKVASDAFTDCFDQTHGVMGLSLSIESVG